jgi:hypothetical protein
MYKKSYKKRKCTREQKCWICLLGVCRLKAGAKKERETIEKYVLICVIAILMVFFHDKKDVAIYAIFGFFHFGKRYFYCSFLSLSLLSVKNIAVPAADTLSHHRQYPGYYHPLFLWFWQWLDVNLDYLFI